jgi:competence protein ComEA
MRARLLWLMVWMLVFGVAAGAVGHRVSAAELVDLNVASFAQLRALPGMGDVYVRRVMAGRPYSAKNQLMTRGVLPQVEYERIASLVVAHRAK